MASENLRMNNLILLCITSDLKFFNHIPLSLLKFENSCQYLATCVVIHGITQKSTKVT